MSTGAIELLCKCGENDNNEGWKNLEAFFDFNYTDEPHYKLFYSLDKLQFKGIISEY
ncbi:unnamed protein product [Meloidogyne enterolobii]|uniref:Uncharacterized protein n=1 Tax=Meloidogyne enterolobii TaxID=390850 RepID=A0ACB1A4L0_MELEN